MGLKWHSLVTVSGVTPPPSPVFLPISVFEHVIVVQHYICDSIMWCKTYGTLHILSLYGDTAMFRAEDPNSSYTFYVIAPHKRGAFCFCNFYSGIKGNRAAAMVPIVVLNLFQRVKKKKNHASTWAIKEGEHAPLLFAKDEIQNKYLNYTKGLVSRAKRLSEFITKVQNTWDAAGAVKPSPASQKWTPSGFLRDRCTSCHRNESLYYAFLKLGAHLFKHNSTTKSQDRQLLIQVYKLQKRGVDYTVF